MMKSLSKLTLFAALLCGGASAAWADTTIGATTQNWETTGSYSDAYELAVGKTLTFTFTVDESAAASEGDDWKGYLAVIQESDTRHTLNANTYSFVRSMCDYNIKNGYWNVGAIYNANTYPSGAKYSHFVGSTVTMTLKRIGSYVEIKSLVTKEATTYTHQYVQDLGTEDNLYAFLCADWAKLTLKSATTVDNNTIGSKESNWLAANSYSNYTTLADGKTLTYIFSVNDSKKNSDSDGYCLDLQKSNTIHDVNNTEDNYTYLFMTSGLWYYSAVGGGWNAGALYNVNNYGSTDKDDFFTGSTVKMVVRRYGTEVIMTTEITKSGTTYTHSYVQNLNTTNDINAFLGADYAVLAMMDPFVTNTDVSASNPVAMPVGASDNSDSWNAIYNQALAPESTVCFHFTNYNDAGSTLYHNWTTGFTYWDSTSETDKYFDVTSGDLAAWGTLNDDNVTSTSSKTNWPSGTSNIMSGLNGADVTMTMSRSGRKVFITAVHTPTSGDPFTFKYTFEPKADYTGFATSNVWVRLVGRYSHFTLYYPTDKVNIEVNKTGWATFSSDYKLDFTGISGLDAYAVTGNDDKVITMSDALGVVDAGTGVLLKGTAGDASTYFNVPVSTGVAYSGTNRLVAGEGTNVTGGDDKTFVLVANGGNAMFKKLNSTGAVIGKGKAYLKLESAVSAPALYFDFGDQTGIDEIEKVEKRMENPVFDLQGRKVAQPAKGLYIVNGKKYVVK